MKSETLVTAISFTCFGVLVGWILGSQQIGPAVASPAPTEQAAGAGDPGTGSGGPPPALDSAHAAELERTANAQPADAAVRVQLADLYFDSQRYDLAAPWYEAALKLAPGDADASTDLGVCYYNLNQIDRALAQFDHSLTVDPRHAKTLLNQGIVRAFGKQDLRGAVQSWQKVVAMAPGTEEAKRAERAIEDVRSAHPEDVPGAAPGAGRGGL